MTADKKFMNWKFGSSKWVNLCFLDTSCWHIENFVPAFFIPWADRAKMYIFCIFHLKVQERKKKIWLEDSTQIEFFCSWEAKEGTLSLIDIQGQAHINQSCMMLCDAFCCNLFYWYTFKTMDYADFITWTAILVAIPEGLWCQMYCGRQCFLRLAKWKSIPWRNL